MLNHVCCVFRESLKIGVMNLLQQLLSADPARPRITIYDDQAGTHLDFSAKLLENWTAKVANMLREELDLEPGDSIYINLPIGWQPVMIALGAIAAEIQVSFEPATTGADVVFYSPETNLDQFDGDVVLVTTDPFGRGVVEAGGFLPDGAIDFGPVVRMYGDQFYETTSTFGDLDGITNYPVGTRLLSTGWRDWPGFCDTVLSPLAAVGSAVIVTGHGDQDRLDHIATVEKATALLVL